MVVSKPGERLAFPVSREPVRQRHSRWPRKVCLSCKAGPAAAIAWSCWNALPQDRCWWIPALTKMRPSFTADPASLPALTCCRASSRASHDRFCTRAAGATGVAIWIPMNSLDLRMRRFLYDRGAERWRIKRAPVSDLPVVGSCMGG